MLLIFHLPSAVSEKIKTGVVCSTVEYLNSSTSPDKRENARSKIFVKGGAAIHEKGDIQDNEKRSGKDHKKQHQTIFILTAPKIFAESICEMVFCHIATSLFL